MNFGSVHGWLVGHSVRDASAYGVGRFGIDKLPLLRIPHIHSISTTFLFYELIVWSFGWLVGWLVG